MTLLQIFACVALVFLVSNSVHAILPRQFRLRFKFGLTGVCALAIAGMLAGLLIALALGATPWS